MHRKPKVVDNLPVRFIIESLQERGFKYECQDGGTFSLESPDSSKKMLLDPNSDAFIRISILGMLNWFALESAEIEAIVEDSFRRCKEAGEFCEQSELVLSMKTYMDTPLDRRDALLVQHLKKLEKTLSKGRNNEEDKYEPDDRAEAILERYLEKFYADNPHRAS